jgi:hypothetical protein
LNYFLILKSYLQNRHYLIKIENECTELSSINANVLQGSVLGPLLHLLFTADLLISPETTSAIFADDTAVTATDNDPTIASSKLQTNLLAIQSWLAKWRMKANGSKSTHITFTTRAGTCPSVHVNNVQTEEVKCPGLHLDRRLTWHKHIFTKRKQLGIALTKMHWLLGHKSKLSINNKLLMYKTILKLIWAYGIQLWGTASTSNIEILERFQLKALRVMTEAPWYVPNTEYGRISKSQRLNTKSAVTATTTASASACTQTN